MDSPSNGGRDSRFSLGNYEMPEMQLLGGDAGSEMYSAGGGGILHNRPTSITSGLCRSSVSSSNSCGGSGLQRGLKRGSAEMCYEAGLGGRSAMLAAGECNNDLIEDKYSPNHHPKSSPLSNGKKTKGRVKIKMEYIDNKLRRYTTFSKRKTGIMKKVNPFLISQPLLDSKSRRTNSLRSSDPLKLNSYSTLESRSMYSTC